MMSPEMYPRKVHRVVPRLLLNWEPNGMMGVPPSVVPKDTRPPKHLEAWPGTNLANPTLWARLIRSTLRYLSLESQRMSSPQSTNPNAAHPACISSVSPPYCSPCPLLWLGRLMSSPIPEGTTIPPHSPQRFLQTPHFRQMPQFCSNRASRTIS
jgi:hypothetical protein